MKNAIVLALSTSRWFARARLRTESIRWSAPALVFVGYFLVFGHSVTSLAQVAPLFDGIDGATCTHFNLAAAIRWRNRLGDWIDANGRAQGAVPFDRVLLESRGPQVVTWNVTKAVQSVVAAGERRVGFALVALPEGGQAQKVAAFFAREHEVPENRPALVLEYSDGKIERLVPTADTSVHCSSNKGDSGSTIFRVGEDRVGMIEFDLSADGARRRSVIASATLRLVRSIRYGEVALGAFLLDSPRFSKGAFRSNGLASRYPKDKGIESSPDVYMATSFDTSGWKSKWTAFSSFGRPPAYEVVERDPGMKFEALSGPALRVTIPKGEHLGLNMLYEFKKKGHPEPDDAYFRYYLRLADDWRPQDSGKLPGFAGTYDRAGWGDRPADGLKGWAARGMFAVAPTPGNALSQYQSIGTYAAIPEPGAEMGAIWPWNLGLGGLLLRNRWYCIEQRVKLNAPGAKDGLLQVWIDGYLVFDKTDIRFRDAASIHIEYVWMNVYSGGRDPSTVPLNLYIDDVVIARSYIGPRIGH